MTHQFWDFWHTLPDMGRASILAAIIGAFIAGLFGVLHATIKDRPKLALYYGAVLLLIFGGTGLFLRSSYLPPPPPPPPTPSPTPKPSTPTPPPTPPPTPFEFPLDTGWIFLGAYDPHKDRFVEAQPNFTIVKSANPNPHVVPEQGDIIKALTPRRIIVVGYKRTPNLLKDPADAGILHDEDYTPFTVPIGATIVVRRLGKPMGYNPRNTYARIAKPPIPFAQ